VRFHAPSVLIDLLGLKCYLWWDFLADVSPRYEASDASDVGENEASEGDEEDEEDEDDEEATPADGTDHII